MIYCILQNCHRNQIRTSRDLLLCHFSVCSVANTMFLLLILGNYELRHEGVFQSHNYNRFHENRMISVKIEIERKYRLNVVDT